jgi:hypothetical protein
MNRSFSASSSRKSVGIAEEDEDDGTYIVRTTSTSASAKVFRARAILLAN